MDPKIKDPEISSSADDITEFWIDTTGTIDERAIKCAFFTAVGKDAFTLPRAFVLFHQWKMRTQNSFLIYNSLEPKNAFSAVRFAERKLTIIIKIGKVPVPFSKIRSRGLPIFRSVGLFL